MTNLQRVLAALVLLFVAIQDSISESEATPTRPRVVDLDDPNKGMESRILAIDLADKEKPVAATDEDGYFELTDIRCEQGGRVKFVPANELYYPHQARCPFKGTLVKVGRIQYVQNLALRLREATIRKEYGTAALLSNEVAARANAFDPELASRIGFATYQHVGRALNVRVEQKYMPVSNTPPELVPAIRRFQARKGLDSTGEVDYSTLRALAGRDINAFIYAPAIEPAPDRPESVEELSKQIESIVCEPEC